MKKSLSSLMLVAIALCVAVLPETTVAGAGAVEQTYEVYIGGFPVGIDLYSEGPIVSDGRLISGRGSNGGRRDKIHKRGGCT